jgi:hypothetical protein
VSFLYTIHQRIGFGILQNCPVIDRKGVAVFFILLYRNKKAVMTKLQIEEFQKLEMAYLDSVRAEDGEKQIQMMDLIFFWLRKQMRAAQATLVLVEMASPIDVEVSEIQKQEFTFLQMAMIKKWAAVDREGAQWIELKMREWIDIQVTAAVNKVIKPELKIIRNYKN